MIFPEDYVSKYLWLFYTNSSDTQNTSRHYGTSNFTQIYVSSFPIVETKVCTYMFSCLRIMLNSLQLLLN